MNYHATLFTLGLISVSSLAYAQEQGFLGGVRSPILDPLSRAQQPAPAAAAPVPAAVATRSGTVVVTISGSIRSTVPASRKLYCLCVISAPRQSKLGKVLGTISGSAFTCTQRLAYLWQVDPAYSLDVSGTLMLVDASLPVTEAAQSLFMPAGLQTVFFPPTTPFPANGATTTKTMTGVVF